MYGLVQRGVAVQILQLHEVHACLVSESPEGTPQVMMGDPDSVGDEPRPTGRTLQEQVGAGSGDGHYRRLAIQTGGLPLENVRGLGEHRQGPPLSSISSLPENAKTTPVEVDVLQMEA